jgi:hypothetical protein
MAKLSKINAAICSRFDVFPESIKWCGIGTREFKPDGKTFVYLDDKITVGEIDIYCVKCLSSGKIYASIADLENEKKVPKERVSPCK